jgi:cobalt/nickel transport system permease protein
MFELFSDIFACRDNVLTRIDPRAKLIVTVVLIFSVILSTKVFLPVAVLGVCLFGMLAVCLPLGLVLLRLLMPLTIVAVLVLLQTFLTEGTPIFQLRFLGFEFVATEEGLNHGILLGSRVLGAVSAVLLLSSVTPAHKIFTALRWFRVPEGWVEIALLVYRYSFALLDQATDVATAQRVRLGYSTMRRSFASLGTLAGTVLGRSLDQAMRTCDAMSLRGWRGSIPLSPLPKMALRDRLLIASALPLVTSAYLLQEWWFK